MIWISDDIDGVIVNEFDKVLAFSNKELLLKYAERNNIFLEGDVTTYQIDKLQKWLLNPFNNFDCEEFLNFWNLCTDISVSTKKIFNGDIKTPLRNSLYNKLFDCNALFIVEDPNPTFDNTDIKELQSIVEQGLKLLLDDLVVITT